VKYPPLQTFIFGFDEHGAGHVLDATCRYMLRPETIESVFYMYRVSGGDRRWQDVGWTIFLAFVAHCRTPTAYSGVRDVTTMPLHQVRLATVPCVDVSWLSLFPAILSFRLVFNVSTVYLYIFVIFELSTR
jgi:hypothetical protein